LEWMSLWNELRMWEEHQRNTDGGGKLPDKTAGPGRQEESVREPNTSQYHRKTRSPKSSNQNVTGGWDQVCGLVTREASPDRVRSEQEGSKANRHFSILLVVERRRKSVSSSHLVLQICEKLEHIFKQLLYIWHVLFNLEIQYVGICIFRAWFLSSFSVLQTFSRCIHNMFHE